MRVRFGFDFGEAGMASGLNSPVLAVKQAAPSLLAAQAGSAPVLVAPEASLFSVEALVIAGSAAAEGRAVLAAPTETYLTRSFKGITDAPVVATEVTGSSADFNGDTPMGCMCCFGTQSSGGGIGSSNGGASSSGSSSGSATEASAPGLTVRLFQYWDAGDNRYEYSGNQSIDGILMGSRWDITNLTFSFPTNGDHYGNSYFNNDIPDNLVAFNAAQQNAARYALGLISSYTNLNFTEITETSTAHGNIRMAQTTSAAVGSASGRFPGSDPWDGDIWFGQTGQPFYLTPQIGNWGMATQMHEIGHTMGLKHGHSDDTLQDNVPPGYIDGPGPRYGSRPLPSSEDGQAWSLMTYRSDPGNSVSFQGDGFNQPQTYMMNDIAALQYMYGADFTSNGGNSVYTFNTSTGEMFINGVSQGVPMTSGGFGKILRTIWDGNGTDTYDFSNFTGNQTINLAPGEWSTMSTARLANHRAYSGGTAWAPGNVANARLYNNDTRSLIENANGGSGDDDIFGNQANNVLRGNGGNDSIDDWAGGGNDTMYGDAGNDTLWGWDGNDYLYGGADNDSVYGESGNDYIDGQTGNDYLSGGTGNDTVWGDANNDTIFGSDGDDNLYGEADADTLNGGIGNDYLSGGSDADSMVGGDGNDTYVVDNAGDSVTELANEGTDLVNSSITYTLGANVENLTLTGSQNRNGTGNSLNNVINGNSGNNTLTGGGGTDTINGGGGNDYIWNSNYAGHSLNGDSGNDTIGGGFQYGSTWDGGDGTDLLDMTLHDFAATYNLVAGTYTTNNGTLNVLNFENVTAGTKNDVIIGTSGANSLNSGGGDDSINAGAGEDTVLAGGGNDTITDTQLMGTSEDDVYDGGDGIDTLIHDFVWLSSVTFNLAAGFATLNGNNRDQLISIENLVIGGSASVVGSSVANHITVNGTGANAIDAGAGQDTVLAGGGNDTITDTQTMGVGESDVYDGGDGIDTLIHDIGWTSSVTFDLAAGFATVGGSNRDQLISIENLIINGEASVIGSSVANHITINGSGGNAINAGAGEDTVLAGGGNDTITDTHNIFGSGQEDDVYNGGDGTDTLVHDLNWVSSVVFNLAAGFTTFSGNRDQLISIENLVIGGSAGVIGSSVANVITVNGTGDNSIDAGGGDDVVNAGGGNDSVQGGSGVDTINGGDGNDTIDGGTGVGDMLYGEAGDDLFDYQDGSGFDNFYGGDGNDTVDFTPFTSSLTVTLGAAGTYYFVNTTTFTMADVENVITGDGNDSLTGDDQANILTAGGGNDTIDGGLGNDTINGEAGNDVIVGGGNSASVNTVDGGDGDDHITSSGSGTYLGGIGSDTILAGLSGGYPEVLDGGDGIDTLDTSSYSPVGMTYNINMTTGVTNYTGESFINFENLITGNGDHVIVGTSAANSITTGDGDDDIDAGGGNDTINSGSGNDFVHASDGGVKTYNTGSGNDTVGGIFGYNSVFDGGSGTDLLDMSFVPSTDLPVVVNLTAGTYSDGFGSFTLLNFENYTGFSVAEDITGTSGANRIDGGLGDDTMRGGNGNDTYYVDSVGDNVVESSGGATGTDTIYSTVTYTLAGRFVEFLRLTGAANINATGNSAAQTLVGNDGNNRIDGLGGADTMRGGLGNDTFVVDNIADVVDENPGEGTDTVETALTFSLAGLFIENLTLTGVANVDGTGNGSNNVLTGNSGNNVLTGGNGNDTYYIQNTGDNVVEVGGGSSGTDTIYSSVTYDLSGRLVEFLRLTGSANINATGNGQAQTLVGNDGNNRLDGLAGADTMRGGLGNDTFVVDNVSDVVDENPGEGTDTVESNLTFSLAGLFIENLTLTGAANVDGTGNGSGNVLTGNSGDNVLTGGNGDDTYYIQNVGDNVVETSGGSSGTDTIFSTVTYDLAGRLVEFLTLTGSANINATGNSQAQTLKGNSGNNILNGLAGADTMIGGNGNDTFYVDNAGDVVTEASGQGTDIVFSSVSFSLVGNHIEDLTLTGASNIDATGNGIANVLNGNTGNNLIDGGSNADTMTGGIGNDTYVVDNAGDVVNELVGEGTDEVRSSLTYSLAGTQLENLTLTGAGNINGTGNNFANVLTGNSGNNILTGGTGSDTYYIQNAGDNVVELSGQGTDTIFSSVSYSLAGRFIEFLTLTGSDNIDATGNSQGQTLTGNSGNNTLTGLGGADAFLFLFGSGDDIIADFSLAQGDTIGIAAAYGPSALTQVGADVLVDLGGTGDTITVLGATVANVATQLFFIP